MKNDRTPHAISNSLRLIRTLFKGTFLVVEGETDERVYKRFKTSDESCRLILAYDKDKALEVLRILGKDGFMGLLVIVDADFWRLEGKKPDSINLLLTDTHDLETMILSNSQVMPKILEEFGSRERIKRLKKPVMDLMIEGTLPLGILRWLSSSSRDNLRFQFKELDVENFIDKRNLRIDLDQLIEFMIERRKDLKIEKAAVKKRFAEFEKENPDPWQVCSGHDMIRVLTVGLLSLFGNKKAKYLTAEVLEGSVRMSYEYIDFKNTRLYRAIRDWERAHPPFQVLE